MRLLILSLLITFNSFGQKEFEVKDRTYSVGLFTQLTLQEAFPSGIEFGLLYRKHWLNLAVGSNPFSDLYVWSSGLDYDYLPNSYGNRFNLLFNVNCLYTVDFGWKSNNKHPRDFEAFAGTGFNLNFSDHFNMKFKIGAGYEFKYEHFDLHSKISFGYRF